MADRTGQRVGNYRLMRLLGKGGFAEVYLGEHIHLGTQAAVKLLRAQLASEDAEGFRLEARTIARLVHPNIVRVLDFGVEDGVPFLVMDHAPNGTLRQRHPKGAPISIAQTIVYVKQVAEALQYAHEQRLIHRDIKPENMLLGRNNEVLLSDFGIALAAQSTHYQSAQNIAGTILYMAPEQIQAHPRPASDQYSLGVVTYEWLSGSRPFQGTFTEIAVKHSLTAPAPLRGQVPGLSPAVEEVVMIALKKDPHQRFPNVRAFAQALEQASQQGVSPQLVRIVQQPASTSALSEGPVTPTPSINPHTQFRGLAAFAENNTTPINTDSVMPASPSPIMMIPSIERQVPPPEYSGTPSMLLQHSYAPYATPPPQADYAFYGPSPTMRPQRSLTRRGFVAGAIGLAIGGGATATWFALSRRLSPPPGDQPPAPDQPALVTYAGHSDNVWTVDWSPDGRYIASGSADGTAQIWEAQTGKHLLSYRSPIQSTQPDDGARTVTWSPDSKQLLIGFKDGTAQLLDITSKGLHIIKGAGPFSPINTAAWSPDGKYIAIGCTDGTIRVYDLITNKVLIYTEHNASVQSLVWSPDGTRIVSASSDGTVKVWLVANGQTLLNYTNQKNAVTSVSWSHDGTRIVSAARDVQVWDAGTGHTLFTYSQHKGGAVLAVAWSHNDVYIASGGTDGTHIWEAKTGNRVRNYNTGAIFSLAWSPDDTRIVTASVGAATQGKVNKVVQVWKVR